MELEVELDDVDPELDDVDPELEAEVSGGASLASLHASARSDAAASDVGAKSAGLRGANDAISVSFVRQVLLRAYPPDLRP